MKQHTEGRFRSLLKTNCEICGSYIQILWLSLVKVDDHALKWSPNHFYVTHERWLAALVWISLFCHSVHVYRCANLLAKNLTPTPSSGLLVGQRANVQFCRGEWAASARGSNSDRAWWSCTCCQNMGRKVLLKFSNSPRVFKNSELSQQNQEIF